MEADVLLFGEPVEDAAALEPHGSHHSSEGLSSISAFNLPLTFRRPITDPSGPCTSGFHIFTGFYRRPSSRPSADSVALPSIFSVDSPAAYSLSCFFAWVPFGAPLPSANFYCLFPLIVSHFLKTPLCHSFYHHHCLSFCEDLGGKADFHKRFLRIVLFRTPNFLSMYDVTGGFRILVVWPVILFFIPRSLLGWVLSPRK